MTTTSAQNKAVMTKSNTIRRVLITKSGPCGMSSATREELKKMLIDPYRAVLLLKPEGIGFVANLHQSKDTKECDIDIADVSPTGKIIAKGCLIKDLDSVASQIFPHFMGGYFQMPGNRGTFHVLPPVREPEEDETGPAVGLEFFEENGEKLGEAKTVTILEVLEMIPAAEESGETVEERRYKHDSAISLRRHENFTTLFASMSDVLIHEAESPEEEEKLPLVMWSDMDVVFSKGFGETFVFAEDSIEKERMMMELYVTRAEEWLDTPQRQEEIKQLLSLLRFGFIKKPDTLEGMGDLLRKYIHDDEATTSGSKKTPVKHKTSTVDRTPKSKGKQKAKSPKKTPSRVGEKRPRETSNAHSDVDSEDSDMDTDDSFSESEDESEAPPSRKRSGSSGTTGRSGFSTPTQSLYNITPKDAHGSCLCRGWEAGRVFFLRAAGKRLRECGGLDLDDADPATQSDAKAEEYRLGAAIIALEAVIGSEYRMRAISSLDDVRQMQAEASAALWNAKTAKEATGRGRSDEDKDAARKFNKRLPEERRAQAVRHTTIEVLRDEGPGADDLEEILDDIIGGSRPATALARLGKKRRTAMQQLLCSNLHVDAAGTDLPSLAHAPHRAERAAEQVLEGVIEALKEAVVDDVGGGETITSALAGKLARQVLRASIIWNDFLEAARETRVSTARPTAGSMEEMRAAWDLLSSIWRTVLVRMLGFEGAEEGLAKLEKRLGKIARSTQASVAMLNAYIKRVLDSWQTAVRKFRRQGAAQPQVRPFFATHERTFCGGHTPVRNGI
jgi:hypothetical protein